MIDFLVCLLDSRCIFYHTHTHENGRAFHHFQFVCPDSRSVDFLCPRPTWWWFSPHLRLYRPNSLIFPISRVNFSCFWFVCLRLKQLVKGTLCERGEGNDSDATTKGALQEWAKQPTSKWSGVANRRRDGGWPAAGSHIKTHAIKNKTIQGLTKGREKHWQSNAIASIHLCFVFVFKSYFSRELDKDRKRRNGRENLRNGADWLAGSFCAGQTSFCVEPTHLCRVRLDKSVAHLLVSFRYFFFFLVSIRFDSPHAIGSPELFSFLSVSVWTWWLDIDCILTVGDTPVLLRVSNNKIEERKPLRPRYIGTGANKKSKTRRESQSSVSVSL